MRIQQLPIEVANQIAAGEVIERPASIVKELLENSLDAQADSIHIEINYGGLNQIKISDNGVGIVAEDLPLAIAAHATSKITRLNDLYAISSMGFRGEALASIASIARLTITSKPAHQTHGMMLTSQDGRFQVSPVARAEGTSIDVRDIFFNAPVRKKFLKSERSEFQAIELIVKRFALGSPSISVHLSHNGKAHLQLASAHDEATRLARISKLLGKSFVEQSLSMDVMHAGMRLFGWISGPSYQRSQNDKLWVYLNGRMVKDKLINHAIKQAYEGLLHSGRNPACLLYLTIDPALVDVNVHPTKHEVRFQQPRFVHDFISSHLSQVLQSHFQITPNLESSEPSRTNNALQIRGLYGNPPCLIKKTPAIEPACVSHHWLALSESFAVVFLHQQPYLIDRKVLLRQWMLDRLQSAPWPLQSRPLLVPVHADCPLLNEDDWQVAQQALTEAGIQVEKIPSSKLAIRTVPILLPDLNLKSFLAAFFDDPLTSSLTALLVSNQINEMSAMTEAQWLDCVAFYESIPIDLRGYQAMVKRLSEKICKDLFDGR